MKEYYKAVKHKLRWLYKHNCILLTSGQATNEERYAKCGYDNIAIIYSDKQLWIFNSDFNVEEDPHLTNLIIESDSSFMGISTSKIMALVCH